MIVGINTTGIGPMDIGGSKSGKIKEQAEQKVSDAFASLMHMTKNTDDKESLGFGKIDDGSKDSISSIGNTKTYFSSSTEKKESVVPESKQSDSGYVKKGETDTDSKKDVDSITDKRTDSNSADEKEIEGLKGAISDLKEKIKDVLQIDDNELSELLEESGLTMLDLLNPDVLKGFALQISDATEVDLLINEDINKMMGQLMQALDEVLLENNLDVENIPEVDMASVFEVKEEPLTTEIITEEEVVVSDDDENGQDNDYISKTVDADTHKLSDVQTKITVESDQQNQSFNQNLQGNTDSIIDNFDQALNQVVNVDATNGAEFTESIEQIDIVRQVVEEIKVNFTKEVTSLSIRLNPEQLGNVQITVASKDGMMQARIIAETEAAKNAIENSIALLKETFENQDLKVDAIEVMVGTGDFFAETEQEMNEENQERNTENKVGGINLNGVSDDEISEDIELEVEMMKAQGNSVSYTV